MNLPGQAATTAVTVSIASSATSTNLFPVAGSGNGRTVFNDSSAILYLKYGATASEMSYTVQIAPGGYYEFPGLPQTLYLGNVDGIWASANGAARLTSW